MILVLRPVIPSLSSKLLTLFPQYTKDMVINNIL